MMQIEVLKSVDRYDTMQQERQMQRFLVDRCELEEEHRNLLQRLHQLRRLLGYPPLLTGKKRREE